MVIQDKEILLMPENFTDFSVRLIQQSIRNLNNEDIYKGAFLIGLGYFIFIAGMKYRSKSIILDIQALQKYEQQEIHRLKIEKEIKSQVSLQKWIEKGFKMLLSILVIYLAVNYYQQRDEIFYYLQLNPNLLLVKLGFIFVLLFLRLQIKRTISKKKLSLNKEKTYLQEYTIKILQNFKGQLRESIRLSLVEKEIQQQEVERNLFKGQLKEKDLKIKELAEIINQQTQEIQKQEKENKNLKEIQRKIQEHCQFISNYFQKAQECLSELVRYPWESQIFEIINLEKKQENAGEKNQEQEEKMEKPVQKEELKEKQVEQQQIEKNLEIKKEGELNDNYEDILVSELKKYFSFCKKSGEKIKSFNLLSPLNELLQQNRI